MSVKKNLDYIIVLGAHVDGTRMTLALLERARRALLYLEENPGTKAVLSGGKGDGENISEAEAMYRYLTGHGINGDRLIREEESTSTKENLEFSRRRIGTTDCSVGVVTNNFMYGEEQHCKKMWIPGSGHGTFQVSKLASFYLHSP